MDAFCTLPIIFISILVFFLIGRHARGETQKTLLFVWGIIHVVPVAWPIFNLENGLAKTVAVIGYLGLFYLLFAGAIFIAIALASSSTELNVTPASRHDRGKEGSAANAYREET